MPVYRYIALLCFLLILFRQGKSQVPQKYAFTHYKLSDGLASNVVNDVVQDNAGYMWLSTNNGLQRFDGNGFVTFHSEAGNAATLPSDEVTKLFKDRNGQLWVATVNNKVGIFDTKNFRYTNVPISGWNQETLIVDKAFLETTDGRLLLLFKKTRNIYEYNQGAKAFVPCTSVPLPENQNVNSILQDKLTQKFIFTTDLGLVMYNPRTKVMSDRANNREAEPLLSQCGGKQFVNYLYLDASRRLFFEEWPKQSTHPFLHVYNMASGEKKRYNLQQSYGLGYHQINGVLEQRNGKRWIYGLPFLAEYGWGPDSLQFLKRDYNKEKEPRFNQVFSLYEDRQQNLWVCTDMGLYLFNPEAQLFHNYTLTTPKRFVVEGKAQSALQMPNGESWVGYRDLGLFRYNQHMQPLPLPAALRSLHESQSVWDIHLHTKTGWLWFALQGGKILVYDTTSKKARLLQPPAFEQRAVTQITEDRNGNLWFGNQSGNIVKWSYNSGLQSGAKAFRLIKRTGIVEKLFTDKEGFVWVAAVREGLQKIDPEKDSVVYQITEANQPGYNLWNSNPKDILQYNDSTLVVASGALNILNTKTLRVRQITRADGLPSNTIQSVAKDADGGLWLGTLNGLCRTDLAGGTFTVYNQNDGLINERFNVAGAQRWANGQLLFMSAESFLIFDPLNIKKDDKINTPFITSFKWMNASLPVDSLLQLKQVNLPYSRTSVAIEFSALNYNKVAKLEYYYRLQGFDTTWTRSDERHQAIYTYLPPGTYQFVVKTKNIAGIYSPEFTYMSLVVNPPFWETWWFYVAIALCVAGMLYLLDRERIKRLTSLYHVRAEIAGQLHKDVSTTLSKINVLSQIAKLKAEKDIVRSKELIDEISGKSYDMMVSMDEILWSIDPANDTMDKTLLRIYEFARTLESAFDASIDIAVHEKVKELRLDMKPRHDFFVVCKEALQCLARCRGNKNISMDIDLAWSKISVKILSSGAGIGDDSLQIQELKKSLQERTVAMQAQLNFEVGKRDISIVLVIPVR
jgi:ligand-binding sensor domain-containing protein